MARGIPPERICYLAFTKKAATEAKERACDRFALAADRLPYFRTIHSLAFRQLGLTKGQVIGVRNYQEFGDLIGVSMRGWLRMDEGDMFGFDKGDRLMFMENLARVRGLSLSELMQSEVNYELFALDSQGEYELDFAKISAAFRTYKQSKFVFDYTDMLSMYVAHGSVPSFDILIIDEGQDLSTLQWSVVQKLAAEAKEVFIAGDDDQAIFRWAGADVDFFINLRVPSVVLEQSYRVPLHVWSVADNIIHGCSNRLKKDWKPRADHGAVSWYGEIEQIDMSEGSWLVLVRNNYMLSMAETKCRSEGYLYEKRGKSSFNADYLDDIRCFEAMRRGELRPAFQARRVAELIPGAKQIRGDDESLISITDCGWPTGIWHESLTRISRAERSYLVAALRRGEKVKAPRIKLSTIHGAKGGEADNVILYTDIAHKSFEQYKKNADDETRVFYVGATRAKQKLHIIEPTTDKSFAIEKQGDQILNWRERIFQRT